MVCLVGKNEAGKTAILHAIAGINPHPLTPIVYDKERDYPRRFLTSYSARHPDGEAIVAKTWWLPEPEEVAEVEAKLGPGTLIKNQPVIVTRRYADKSAKWTLPVDESAAIAFLIDEAQLNPEERGALAGESIDALRKLLESLETPTGNHTALLQRLRSIPNGNLASQVRPLLEPTPASVHVFLALRPDGWRHTRR